ncbi:MAG: hypothetical protein N3G18_08485 [Candidatus Saccharicenans sp.]|nr:hypothetical protein [Candidatus Saccharicenans sp.]
MFSLVAPALVFLVALPFQTGQLAREENQFWQITLRLQVRSDFRGGSAAQTVGEYLLEADWSGFLEEDGPDFIIYHLGAEVVRWELRLDPDKNRGQPVPSPQLKLDYVEGKREDLNFYYSFWPEVLSCPGISPGSQVGLVLPAIPWSRSAEKIPGFSRKVISGDRNLRLSRNRLTRNEVRQEFCWEEETSCQDPGSRLASQRSRVKVVVELKKSG